MNSSLSAIGNFVFVIGLVQIGQYLKINEKGDVNILRLAYGASQVLGLLYLQFLKNNIKSKNEQASVTYVPTSLDGKREKVTTTACLYDLEMLAALLKQQMMSIVIVSLFHYFGGFIQPLFLQIFISWKTLLLHPLSQIHLFKKHATESLARPFTQSNPFSFAEPPKESTPQTTATTSADAVENKKKN